jgi:serine/threonine protein kinase
LFSVDSTSKMQSGDRELPPLPTNFPTAVAAFDESTASPKESDTTPDFDPRADNRPSLDSASFASTADKTESSEKQGLTELVQISQLHSGEQLRRKDAQWRTIAEEFSSLLDKDFADVVFKVHGGWYLAAHRALLAAVWPALRDELRTMRERPSPELINLGLAWVTSGGAAPTGELQTAPVAAHDLTGRSTPDIAKRSDSEPKLSEAGVIDVSNRSWGKWSIVRALFCHLYSRPVAIQSDRLDDLRNAAASLGCLELARCCDDAVQHRPRQGKIDRVPSGREGEIYRNMSATSGISRDSSEQLEYAGSSATAEGGNRTPDKRQQSGIPNVGEDKDLKKRDDAWKKSANEARPRVVKKPFGNSSFHEEENKRNAGTTDDGVGIRHVLSDLKRSIVESSRLISDKSFQSIYDMVTDERGILGEGINGPVRMAKNKRTGREVAVKRITAVNMSEQRKQMLLSEVRIFLQVSHRNIVQLIEVYESDADQAVLLVMELCTGKELFERLAERKVYSEFDAARVTRQMLDAVAHLHSQNIVHRDLKLENWLYESPHPDAKLKLCDFGFGQIVEPSVQLTATLGSLYYVAPEVLEGSYGLPCDMWSMGVIVYMLLIGNPPFDGKTDGDVINKIKAGRFGIYGKRWEGVSETAKHFLHSLLRKDPYERLSASEAQQHAWLGMEDTAKRVAQGKVSNPEAAIDQSVIRDIGRFARNNAISRAALSLLASSSAPGSFHGAEEDVMSLEQRFKRFDGQNNGKIDAEDFTKVLKDSLQVSSTEAAKVFERISANQPDPAGGEQKIRKREINYNEFIALTKNKRIANNSAAIRDAFRAYDKDGEGFIHDNQIRDVLGADFKGDEDLVKINLKECDMNGDGMIDYVRFAALHAEVLSKKDNHEMKIEDQGAVTSDPTASSLGQTTRQNSIPHSPPSLVPRPAPVLLSPSSAKDGQQRSSKSPTSSPTARTPERCFVLKVEGEGGSQDDLVGHDEEQNDEEYWAARGDSDCEEQLVNVGDKERETSTPSDVQQRKEDGGKKTGSLPFSLPFFRPLIGWIFGA